jgi:hypothetical protein
MSNSTTESINIADIVALFGPENNRWPLIYDNSFFNDKFMNMNYLAVGLDSEPFSDLYINSKIISKVKFINLTGSDNENNIMKKLGEISNLAKKYQEYKGDDEFLNFGNNQFVDWDDVDLINLNCETNRNELYKIIKNLESLEILKVNSEENVFWVINTVIECGFLPSIIYAKFPEKETHETLTNAYIGNLRNLGYSLLCNFEGKCLFYLGEPLVYEYTKCTEASARNPLIETIIKTTVESYKAHIDNPTTRFCVKFKPYTKLSTISEMSSSSELETKT